MIRLGSASGTYNLGIRASSTPANTATGHTYWTGDLTANTDTHLVVVRYVQGPDSTSGTDDSNDLWLDPAAASFGAPEGSEPSPDGSALGAINTGSPANNYAGVLIIGAGIAKHACPDQTLIDEIRVGTTWTDVTTNILPTRITSQPGNATTITGGAATFSVGTVFATSFQWYHNGNSIGNGTQYSLTLTNVQLSDAGTYHVVVSGPSGSPITSSDATLTIYPDIYPRLVPLWSLAPGSRPYVTTDGANNPNQRSIAYDAAGNRLLIASRQSYLDSTLTNSYTLTNAGIWVVNGDSGADLFEMNSNGIAGGYDTSAPKAYGTNLLTLVSVDIAGDGAVYACNAGNVNVAPNYFQLYYWPTNDSTTAPVAVFQGDASHNLGLRMGDCMAVRGSGAGTQVLLLDQTGVAGAVLVPGPGNINDPASWTDNYFTNVTGGNVNGRTLLYYGSANAFWEKHTGDGLTLVSYDPSGFPLSGTSAIVTNYPNLPTTPNLVAFNANTNLLVAIDRSSPTNAPDTVDQWAYDDPGNPVLVRSYNFPVNHQANNNGPGKIIVSGDRVYALDSNNGIAAFRIEPVLHITTDPGNVVLSWSTETPGYMVYTNSSVTNPGGWGALGGTPTIGGNQYFQTNSISTGTLFYRLQK